MLKYGGRILKSRFFGRPFYCMLRVTSRCNLRCRMCSVWKHGNKGHEMSLEEISELKDTFKKLNVSVVNLSGGEPMLREDLPDIVKIFSKDFEVRMQTNSTLANEEKIKELVKAGLKSVSISLDTINPKKQDFICNQRGIWYKIIEKMVLFSELMPNDGLLLSNAVVSKLNIDELPKLTILTNKMGYATGFVPVLLSEKREHDYAYRDYSPNMTFQKSDYHIIEKSYTELIKMKKEGYRIFNSTKFLQESIKFFKGGFRWKCDAGKLYFLVDYDGSFLPCTELSKIGSVLDADFVKKFDSNNFRKIVEDKVANCPNCMHPCYVESSKLMHDNAVSLEKFKVFLNLKLKKRDFIDYEQAIKYADFNS
jgi:MoaA/NifB/PqqE/SkfB family radical SAM enzyme